MLNDKQYSYSKEKQVTRSSSWCSERKNLQKAISPEGLVSSLKQLMQYRPKPKRIRTDNGPEFISKTFVQFSKDSGSELQYIQPGKPAQNAYIERLNRTFREMYWMHIYSEVYKR